MYSVVNNLKLQEGERVYFQSSDATVTDARAIISGKTYALRNVTSVVMVKKAPGNSVPTFSILLGMLLAWLGISTETSGLTVTGILFILFGAIIIAMAKPNYIVRLGSSSGESDALILPSQETVQKIVDAMNEAIVHRK